MRCGGRTTGFEPWIVYTWRVVQKCVREFSGLRTDRFRTTKGIIMPKLKTHSGAAKRFTKTGTGKFKRGHSKMRHILTSKNNKTKSRLGKSGLVSDADHYNVSRMLPYA
ncbi:ribosomal protein L35 [Granulicella tundricola MP5ACTX9]|uniref:Large ribosomal subunit protein bL35 n=2 Tax=Granulicella TaxID=940557 RepID=E8X3A3_GRATM|nr:ribosomal protein L35 [Granulicella tundricola MP5ACTX9]